MKVELLHPVTHDGKEYSRGVHELPEDVAKLFLTYEWAARKAQLTSPPEGRVTDAPDAPDASAVKAQAFLSPGGAGGQAAPTLPGGPPESRPGGK